VCVCVCVCVCVHVDVGVARHLIGGAETIIKKV
jgi:hypothetical protein